MSLRDTLLSIFKNIFEGIEKIVKTIGNLFILHKSFSKIVY